MMNLKIFLKNLVEFRSFIMMASSSWSLEEVTDFFFLGVRGIAWYMLIYQGVKIIQLCNEENIFGIFLICNSGIEKVRLGYKSVWKMENYFCIFENDLKFLKYFLYSN